MSCGVIETPAGRRARLARFRRRSRRRPWL